MDATRTKDLVNVDDTTVATAYKNFVIVFYPGQRLADPGYGLYFWHFIGMETSPQITGPGWNMPPEAARRCHLLTSPHYRAVAKLLSLKGHRHDIQAEHRL